LIAERVARRVSENRSSESERPAAPARSRNGAPVREEISAIREGLHDLESKLEGIESKLGSGSNQTNEPSRARVIDFISTGPPLRSASSIAQPASVAETSEPSSSKPPAEFFQFVPATQSPWLGRMSSMLGKDNPQPASFNPQTPSHASQERFGVEEATVKELVEFFESEKKCSVEPGGKPCDHCAMCNTRGF
jgi:hypothetical protein